MRNFTVESKGCYTRILFAESFVEVHDDGFIVACLLGERVGRGSCRVKVSLFARHREFIKDILEMMAYDRETERVFTDDFPLAFEDVLRHRDELSEFFGE